jgi:hypothetical protein
MSRARRGRRQFLANLWEILLPLGYTSLVSIKKTMRVHTGDGGERSKPGGLLQHTPAAHHAYVSQRANERQ